MPYALPGGPKLVAIDIATDSIVQTYTFPETVHYVDSYLNDVRIDLSPNVTDSGKGIAYIADSSNEGRPSFIVLDLGSGQSWRQLSQDPSTLTPAGALDSYLGVPSYRIAQGAKQFSYGVTALDGIQISPDGGTIYYSPLYSSYLYSIETKYLRDHTSPAANAVASSSVRNLGQRGGFANGYEGDSNGLVYQLIPDQNAIFAYDPARARQTPFVRDPRILWPDSASVAEDGYIYWNVNQLFDSPGFNNGTDLRVKPGLIMRARCPGNGTKIRSG